MSEREATALAKEAMALLEEWLGREDRVCELVDSLGNHMDQLDCVRREGKADDVSLPFPDLKSRLEVKIVRRSLAKAREVETEVKWLQEATKALRKR